MARNYEEADDDYAQGRANLWRASLCRAIKGKRGQANLRDLERAFEEEWEWTAGNGRLISDDLCRDGEVCVVGLLARHRLAPEQFATLSRDWQEEFEPGKGGSYALAMTAEIGQSIGLQLTIAYELGAQNDEDAWETPEKRFLRVWESVRYNLYVS